MANFNNRGDNSRFGGSGGRLPFGGNRSGKPSFTKKSWGDSRSSDRPVTLYKATCANCNRECEVPFRPIGGKPVYCKDCFDKKGGHAGGDRGGDRFPRRDFTARDFASPQFEKSGSTDVTILRQLEAVNTKLLRLIQAVEALAFRTSVEAEEKPKEVSTPIAKKSSKKKAVKK